MRLIDADALMQSLGVTNMDCYKCAWGDKECGYCKRGGDFEDACCAIEDAPTIIDAVPVVRCRDCVHYIKHDKRCGIWNHGGIVPYGFCFLGERRTNETD